MPDEKIRVSMHVLPASATLLGLCFVVLSSIKVLGVQDKTLIDELSGAATLFFLASSIFSYASMRTVKRAVFFERLADIIFIGGLSFLTLVSLIIIFGLVK
jgi:hypothetical protein